MNKVSKLKSIVVYFLNDSPEYEVIEKRIMQHPIRKDLESFNISFCDREKSIRYTVIGCQTEEGYCSMDLKASFFTGIEEDIEEKKRTGDYHITIKNFGKGKEALVEMNRWFMEDLNLDFEEAIKILKENGINKLLYKFIRTSPPSK